ncbi:MAG TPA: hypothetical protein VFL12_10615, partial [Thermoanaerobaculia bacterium]|nr:hypothetical protein [Thermoanaerobaculia bacterium]
MIVESGSGRRDDDRPDGDRGEAGEAERGELDVERSAEEGDPFGSVRRSRRRPMDAIDRREKRAVASAPRRRCGSPDHEVCGNDEGNQPS